MTESVPNEILEVILGHALAISTSTFERWRTQRTYCSSPRSTVPDILLVSKRWHALGTPALYEAAIIRSSSQAQKLAAALALQVAANQGQTDQHLKRGWYLRRLRIEGGYGDAFIKVLTAAPGITTLYLCYGLTNDDSMAGLIRTFRKIQPEQLFLDSIETNGASDHVGINLSKAIAGALPNWTKLKRIVASDQFVIWPDLLRQLPNTPALEHVSISSLTAVLNIDGNNLEEIAKNPSVRVIQMRDLNKTTPATLHLHADYTAKQKLWIGQGNNMVKLTEFPEVDVTGDYARPLPELPDKILAKILGHATHICGPDYLDLDDDLFSESTFQLVNKTRKQILLVNKKLRAIALPYFYGIPHCRSEGAVDKFVAHIHTSNEFASFVKMLYIPDRFAKFQDPKRISVPLTSLLRVDKHFRVFPEIAKYVQDGETHPLERMEQILGQDPVDPAVWSKFPRLKEVTLHGGSVGGGGAVNAGALSHTESLYLWDSAGGVLDIFATMNLPSLCEFGFSLSNAHEAAKFLEVHGNKLRVLSIGGLVGPDVDLPILDLCPHIAELRLVTNTAPHGIPFISSSRPHLSIKRLTFPTLPLDRRHSPNQDAWDTFLKHLTEHRPKLPALEEFRVLLPFDWPTNHFQYNYTFKFTPVIHDLHELGIAFTDGSGTRWTRFDPLRRRRRAAAK